MLLGCVNYGLVFLPLVQLGFAGEWMRSLGLVSAWREPFADAFLDGFPGRMARFLPLVARSVPLLDVARTAAHDDWAVGVVDQVVADRSQDGASHFAHPPGASDNHSRAFLFRNTTDHLSGFPSCCAQHTRHLRTQDNIIKISKLQGLTSVR